MNFGVKEICEAIWKLEKDYELLSKEIQGIKIWQIIRGNIYMDISLKIKVFSKPHTRQRSLFERIKLIPNFFSSCIYRNPLKEKEKKDIWIFDHPRKKNVDGKYIDIYTQDLIESLNQDNILILEKPYMGKHFTEDENNRMHTEYIQVLTFLKSFFISIKFTNEEILLIRTLETELNKIFGINICLEKKIRSAIRKYKSRFSVYNEIFKKQRPRKIFLVVSYLHSAIIAAAKHNKIPVVEIQHGIISPYHLGYNFPDFNNELDYFPDYIYSFGEYWSKHLNLPLNREKIILYGFPHFNKLKKKYNHIQKKSNQIIFISQGTIGQEMTKLAYNLALKAEDYNIIYKLHPGEYDRWKKDYIALQQAERLKNFKIVDTDEINLYQYLSESQYQVGVYSTALFEGIAFKCYTILLDLPGLDHMEPIMKDGLAIRITSVEQLITVLKSDYFKNAIDPNYFFYGIDP